MQFGLILIILFGRYHCTSKTNRPVDKRWSLHDVVYDILEEDILSNLEAPEWYMRGSRIYYFYILKTFKIPVWYGDIFEIE